MRWNEPISRRDLHRDRLLPPRIRRDMAQGTHGRRVRRDDEPMPAAKDPSFLRRVREGDVRQA